MSLLRSFCTPYGAPGRLYYDSYEFFKCGPQADLRAWRKLAVTFFAQQIQIGNSLGWFLTLWTTHSCKNQLVANFFPDILHYSLTIKTVREQAGLLCVHERGIQRVATRALLSGITVDWLIRVRPNQPLIELLVNCLGG